MDFPGRNLFVIPRILHLGCFFFRSLGSHFYLSSAVTCLTKVFVEVAANGRMVFLIPSGTCSSSSALH